MSQFDSNKDYYAVLGVDKEASQVEIDRSYKRMASKHHPDRGGSEERMKLLNEAYGVLKDTRLRRDYDAVRRPSRAAHCGRICSRQHPTARDVGVFGHFLSAGLCLIAGLFLLLLLRLQWIWFLVAARDSGCVRHRVWRVARAQRDGEGERLVARDESFQAAHEDSGSRVLAGDHHRLPTVFIS